MPAHTHYCEAFCGGASVLLEYNSQPRSELINDIDGNLTNFWRVLQNKDTFPEFMRLCSVTPLSRNDWDVAKYINDSNIGNNIVRAWAYFVYCRQSLVGRMQEFAIPTRTRLRREMNDGVSAWLSAVEYLPEVHQRLIRVFVENMDACKLIQREDTPATLFYCDLPYLPETRVSKDVYKHEMSHDDHIRFLDIANKVKGKMIISGYPSELYNNKLADWKRVIINIPNHASQSKVKAYETECLWMNYK